MLQGLHIITPRIFSDHRGSFFESYNAQTLAKDGIDTIFVQDNQSHSAKNVLRGLHFQRPPFAQAKLVRVLQGAALDIAVDIRKASPTYGQHYSILLSADNNTQFYIPEGFAHGFLSLADDTIFCYKCSNYYHQASEDGLLWNDEKLGINWGIESPILSPKDEVYTLFKDFSSPF